MLHGEYIKSYNDFKHNLLYVRQLDKQKFIEFSDLKKNHRLAPIFTKNIQILSIFCNKKINNFPQITPNISS